MSKEDSRRNLMFANQRKAFARIRDSEEKLDELAALVLRCDNTHTSDNHQQNAQLGLIVFRINCACICFSVFAIVSIIIHMRLHLLIILFIIQHWPF